MFHCQETGLTNTLLMVVMVAGFAKVWLDGQTRLGSLNSAPESTMKE
jgi:hypothetical protein